MIAHDLEQAVRRSTERSLSVYFYGFIQPGMLVQLVSGILRNIILMQHILIACDYLIGINASFDKLSPENMAFKKYFDLSVQKTVSAGFYFMNSLYRRNLKLVLSRECAEILFCQKQRDGCCRFGRLGGFRRLILHHGPGYGTNNAVCF